MRRRVACSHLVRGFCEPCRIESRRATGRRCAQRQRDRELARRNAGARTCQRREGRFGVCGGMLATDVDSLGRTVVRCERCERRRRGICRDCPARVYGTVGRALRCARCAECATRESIRRSEQLHKEERRKRALEAYHADAERKARKLAYKRAWRKANPDKVRAQKRREALAQGAHRLNWHRRYNRKKKRQESKRRWARARYYELHPDRPVPCCTICQHYIDWTPGPGKGRPPVRCDGCARPKEKLRRAERGVAYVAVTEPPSGDWVPVIPERKPRTCLTPGCSTVVTGREKKCAACKRAEREIAQRLLVSRQGRGRRTDLENVA